jgi:hypothetical protein
VKGATPITLFRLLAAAAVAVTAVLAPAAALARQPSPDEQLTKAVAARSVSA